MRKLHWLLFALLLTAVALVLPPVNSGEADCENPQCEAGPGQDRFACWKRITLGPVHACRETFSCGDCECEDEGDSCTLSGGRCRYTPYW